MQLEGIPVRFILRISDIIDRSPCIGGSEPAGAARNLVAVDHREDAGPGGDDGGGDA